MFLQGHVENGLIVTDEPVSFPNGTVVRIEPLESSRELVEPIEQASADSDRPLTNQQMAKAWRTISKPAAVDEIRLSIDPDDYPLY